MMILPLESKNLWRLRIQIATRNKDGGLKKEGNERVNLRVKNEDQNCERRGNDFCEVTIAISLIQTKLL